MSRHRSNTTIFHWRRPGSLASLPPSADSTPQAATPDIADLISSLLPPLVPSLSYARSLASLLPTASPPPKRSLLLPIWASMCDPHISSVIQAAGFDLLAAYFENEHRDHLTTADRLTCFSLFTALGDWAVDTWEPRLKALRGMTGYGTDLIGIEEPVLELLKSWIHSAFDDLLVLEARAITGQEEPSHARTERERCITLCAEFIAKILERPDNIARISDDALNAIIAFYGILLDRAIQLPRTKGYDPASEEPDEVLPPLQSPHASAPGSQSHRRSASTSTSASGGPSLVHLKHPLEIAATLYLSHLSTQIKFLTPAHLQDVIPTLFRVTAFCTTPLSRLSIVSRHQVPSPTSWKREMEDNITDFLSQLLSGPYASLSKLILNVWLGPPGTTPRVLNPPPLFLSESQTPVQSPQPFPPRPSLQSSRSQSPPPTSPPTPHPPPRPLHPTSSTLFTIHTCLGAQRTLRTTLRRSLISRLPRAYLSRETSVPPRPDLDPDVMERGGIINPDLQGGWKGQRGHEWDIVRIGRTLRWAVRSWVEWEFGLEPDEDEDEENERLKDATERILEEVAGLLKDLLQEVDERSDDRHGDPPWGAGANRCLMEEDESVAIGGTLFELVGWIKQLKNPDGTPHIIRLRPQPAARPRPSHSVSHSFSRTNSASTIPIQFTPVLSAQNPPPIRPGSPSLIRTLTTLLSRSHFTTPLRPLLSLTLAFIADHLTDADLSPLPDIMMRTSELTPTSLGWLENWSAVLGINAIAEEERVHASTTGKGQGPDPTWIENVVSERESGRWLEQHLPNEPQFEVGGGLIGLGCHLGRRKAREEVMLVLDRVYDSIRDMGTYRRALADVVCVFATQAVSWAFDATSLGATPSGTTTAAVVSPLGETRDEFDVLWRLLADEVVLRTAEGCPLKTVVPFLDLLFLIAADGGASKAPQPAPVLVPLSSSPVGPGSPSEVVIGASTTVSPAISRMQSEYAGTGTGTPPSVISPISPLSAKENSTGGSGLISSLLSLAAGTTNAPAIPVDDQLASPHASSPATQDPTLRPITISPRPIILSSDAIYAARSLCGVSGLVSIFGHLAFSPFLLERDVIRLAIQVYEVLLNIVGDVTGRSVTIEARLTALAFLMQLRADADHRVFFNENSFDANGSVETLAGLIGRLRDSNSNSNSLSLSHSNSTSDKGSDGASRARTKERLGRQGSRGRGQSTTVGPGASSRSRSRVPIVLQSQATSAAAGSVKPKEPLWYHPQMWPFSVELNSPSEMLMTYDPAEPSPNKTLLPVAKYLEVLITLLEKEKDWELLSYALCHLPLQLANKHFFCGQQSKAMLSRMVNILCSGLLNKTLVSGCSRQRDAQGLAHHTLEVLVSYWRCLDLQQRHKLVEVFHAGLNEHPSTVRCCLHALTLATVELPVSTTKYLPKILESLSQIMSNPDMAVYILAYLCITVSLPPLYANFTEDDFKTVFGVALQYLQHYSRHNASPTLSWALSQHVRVLSYYVIYIWFLAVRLPDRVRFVKFITRQLLIANEGNETIDGPTEVCFDWLARYTYATADPRPANSLLADIVMNPTNEQPSELAMKEKTWVVGNAVVTIRALARLGWLEVLTRRPSGFTKILCRVENAPLVGPGEVDLDELSIPAVLLMERDPPQVLRAGPEDYEGPLLSTEEAQTEQLREIFDASRSESHRFPRPDPVTGYVWRGSAPSQRRKEVVIDPSYLAIQLSSYPNPPAIRSRADPAAVPRFANTIDRIPVIDTHKVGVLYVAPGQTTEVEILRNSHGSPAYTRFLEGLGRLINLRGQLDVYAGGLVPDEDGEYAYAWWDDIGQILYHTATMMPTNVHDPQSNNKKRHIGNDYVRIVWNDSGTPYRFDTLSTQFQFVNIVIEPHSIGAIATYSSTSYETEYFKVTVQRAPGMTEFVPIGSFKLISGQNLPLFVRQLSLLADWFASVFAQTNQDTTRTEVKTNWQMRLETIERFKKSQATQSKATLEIEGIMKEEGFRDFTTTF